MDLFVDNVDFWDELYKNNNAGWDIKTPNPVFLNLINGSGFLTPCKLLITGSGKGYDAIAAAELGFTVTGIDFSSQAINYARKAASDAGVSLTFLQEDIFNLDENFNESFDAIFEYTTYCAISPFRREEFIKKIVSTLNKKGRLFVLLFPIDGREGGPPFNIDILDFYQLMSKQIKLEYFFRNINSVKPRKGKEVLFIFKKT